MPMRFICSLGLLLACACTPEQPDEFQWVEVMGEQEPCGGTREYLDGVFAEMAASFDADPDGARVRYHWIEESADADCPGGASRCYQHREDGSGDIYERSALGLHELAHAAHYWALPPSRKLLHEGLAMAYDPRPPYSQNGLPYYQFVDGRVDEWLAWEPIDGDPNGYPIGWALVSAMQTMEDMDTFVDYWESIGPQATPEEMKQGFEDRYDESVDTTWFKSENVPSCGRPWCSAVESLPLEGGAWVLEAAGCESSTVLGPDDEQLIQKGVIELTTEADIRVEAEDQLLSISIRQCDDPCGPDDVKMTADDLPTVVTLPPGTYVVTSSTLADVTPQVTLTVL